MTHAAGRHRRLDQTSAEASSRDGGQRPRAKQDPALPQAPYTPSAAERALDERVRRRIKQAPPQPRVTMRRRRDGVLESAFDHPAGGEWFALMRLLEALGTTSPDFALRSLHQLAVLHAKGEAPEAVQESTNAMLAAVAAVKPQDELEGQLAVQMAGTHWLAMNLLSRLAGTADRLLVEAYGTMAVKLLRTYTAQLEALRRHRSCGQQLVRVERVEVRDGGQAIVGTVHHQGGGGGGKAEDQSHARQLGHAPEPALRGADAERRPVPLAGGEG